MVCFSGYTVVFSYSTFIARYPEFAGVSEPQAQAYFDEATDYFANDGSIPVPNAATQLRLLNMVTAHIAWINAPRDANGNPSSSGPSPAPALVGRIASATEGSVSVSAELNGSGSPSEAFFAQTKYGLAFWQASAQYRLGRYVANPTIVAGGGLFPYVGGRPFRRY